MRRIFPLLLVLVVGTALALLPARADDKGDWRQLFNGKDLTGWDTWLVAPRGEKDIIGLNKDPRHVYTVVMEDGKPAIRISGEIFGAITTKDEFDNFHVKLEFKWGKKKWPPRENAVRDSGLLYYCVGPQGGRSGKGPWMESLECQIQEHDCGDFWSVGGPLIDVEAERKGEKGPLLYRKGAPKVTGTSSRVIKSADYEKPTGEWNTIEVLAANGVCVHLVNGKPNLVLTNPRRKVDDKEQPLTKGKLQIQSEGAEVFYRNIAVRPITKVPDEYLK
jgi:hypothetical protein